MDLTSRIDALLVELRQARTQLDRAEKLLADGRAGITARDARLGGAHEILRAHHQVQEAPIAAPPTERGPDHLSRGTVTLLATGRAFP